MRMDETRNVSWQIRACVIFSNDAERWLWDAWPRLIDVLYMCACRWSLTFQGEFYPCRTYGTTETHWLLMTPTTNDQLNLKLTKTCMYRSVHNRNWCYQEFLNRIKYGRDLDPVKIECQQVVPPQSKWDSCKRWEPTCVERHSFPICQFKKGVPKDPSVF